jgi:hypothetical protein
VKMWLVLKPASRLLIVSADGCGFWQLQRGLPGITAQHGYSRLQLFVQPFGCTTAHVAVSTAFTTKLAGTGS